jgi:hypothetical protein
MNVLLFTLSPDCNYAKGKWVPDNKRPLYSGFGCKQWLSAMWACRMMQRTDFAYEHLRWQPKDCQMEEFEGSKFLRRYFVLLIHAYRLHSCIVLGNIHWFYAECCDFLIPFAHKLI